MTDHVAELDEFGRRWAAAEVAGDVDVLDSMATKDFVLVGPLGFLVGQDAVARPLPQRRLRDLRARLA